MNTNIHCPNRKKTNQSMKSCCINEEDYLPCVVAHFMLGKERRGEKSSLRATNMDDN